MIIEQKAIKYQEQVVFERLVMSAKFNRLPKRFPENEACFLFLSQGAFRFRTPNNLLTFNEGDAMLSKCGNYFLENANMNKKNDHSVISATCAFFYPEMVKSFFQTDLSIQSFQNNFDAKKVDIEPLIKSFVDSINFILDNPGAANESFILTKLKELLLLLSKTEKAESINAFVSSLFMPYEYNFNEIIQQNLYSNLSQEELAHLCNISLATFKRRFTETYKQSPAKYMLQKKLEKASELLKFQTKPVSEIAYECGFESISGFDKAFKCYFNKSPSDFRLSQ